MTPAFAISLFRSFYSNRRSRWVPGVYPQAMTVTWRQLVKALTTFRPASHGDKERVPAWSPTTYGEGAQRGKDNVVSLSCLVLDYDDGTSMEAASSTWSDWPHVIHTSWSHSLDLPKFRLVLPLERSIPASGWGRVWRWAEVRSGRVIDPACKDPSRIYFVPALRDPDSPHESHVVDDGRAMLDLDPASLPMTPEEIAQIAAKACRNAAAPIFPTSRRDYNERLKTDSAARLEAAHVLNARIVGNRASGITCPQCSRPDVWFYIEPTKFHGAECNHHNSCGWHGWLDQLLSRVAA